MAGLVPAIHAFALTATILLAPLTDVVNWIILGYTV